MSFFSRHFNLAHRIRFRVGPTLEPWFLTRLCYCSFRFGPICFYAMLLNYVRPGIVRAELFSSRTSKCWNFKVRIKIRSRSVTSCVIRQNKRRKYPSNWISHIIVCPINSAHILNFDFRNVLTDVYPRIPWHTPSKAPASSASDIYIDAFYFWFSRLKKIPS